ncbi:hypothetical protein J437_LFUL017068, partial [Ladona fulva]
QTSELKRYVIDIDRRAFEPTKVQLGNICYNYAEGQGLSHRFNKEKQSAGRDFVESFMKECQLTMRKPESTSAANVTGTKIIASAPRQRLSSKSAKVISAEVAFMTEGPQKPPQQNVTPQCACAMNAIGNFVPPLHGCTGVAHETGWMAAQIFLKYLQHFVNFVHSSAEAPVLLLIDNRATHTIGPQNIFLFVFPPHTSHKLQPLDVAFYSPLTAAYSHDCEDFMVNHPGIKNVVGIFGRAYLKTAIVRC